MSGRLSKVALKMAEPIRILLVSGSPRAKDNCPGEWGKSRRLVAHVVKNPPPNVEFDFLDLAVTAPGDGPKVQPCKACVSTAMPHCNWPCSCYEPGSDVEPDLLWDRDVYGRLERAHGIAVITPINWYSQTSQLKVMFDRLVCASCGNPHPDLTDGKNKTLSRRLEAQPEWRAMRRNHLAGRTACFLVYGDGGANEAGPDGYPEYMREEDKDYDLSVERAWTDPRHAIMNLVMQCRYSGIHVDPEHVVGLTFGKGMSYSVNDMTFHRQGDVHAEAKSLLDSFASATANRVSTTPRVMPTDETLADLTRFDLAGLKKKISGA